MAVFWICSKQKSSKQLFLLLALLCIQQSLLAQSIGNKVSALGADGKVYTGVIKNISNEYYQIKYDGYNELRWLKANQFTLTNGSAQQNDLMGKTVQFPATDGKTYTGIIKEIQGNKYRIKYNGFNFESWLVKEQFLITDGNKNVDASNNSNNSNQAENPTKFTDAAEVQSLQAIFDFGVQKSWASAWFTNKFNAYIKNLSAKDQNALLAFLRQATTASARFFALKTLLIGDSFDVVQNFITQLNQHPEGYQQQKCVVTNRQSIIQQWQYSCSVTMIQTFLADLSPRYAWELKQIASFDVVANDPNCPIAVQQKQLLEKYGGVATPRGDVTGTSIGILSPLSDLITPILGVRFYAKQATEPLPVVFEKMRNQLDKGINVPLLVGFVGTQSRHFVLAMRYQNNGSSYQYLIYDPWDGKCDYVNESTLLAGSLAPLLTDYGITIEYYYLVN